MNENTGKSIVLVLAAYLFCMFGADVQGQTRTSAPTDRMSGSARPASGSHLPPPGEDKAITEDDCTAAKLGSAIPVSAIGEPVSGVTLSTPVWKNATNSAPAYCSVDGSMAPVSKEANANPDPNNEKLNNPVSQCESHPKTVGAKGFVIDC